MNYKNKQYERQKSLIEQGVIFNGVKGGGRFMGKQCSFVLEKVDVNLYAPIQAKVLKYFEENGIDWWRGNRPSGHTLSSQIACLNHLAPIMNNATAVLAIINGIRDEFTEVLPINCDKTPVYIAFEVVSRKDHLNEKHSSRGLNCTSVDALIMAKHKSGKIYLIPIEWKYTESYPTFDKSIDGKMNSKGVKRQRRYNQLIDDSTQLVSLEQYEGSIYYQEPFYQLMRQTLWAEQIIAHRDTEFLQADNYWHIHVIPTDNEALLNRKYKVSGKSMEDTWRSMLKDQSKYTIVDPSTLLAPLTLETDYYSLVEYLKSRYW